jgi:hypothetical protein
MKNNNFKNKIKSLLDDAKSNYLNNHIPSKEEIIKTVNNYSTKNKEGFTDIEIRNLINQFPTINLTKFNDAFNGNTCMVINNEIINYHCDVINAIICGVENRELRLNEWD